VELPVGEQGVLLGDRMASGAVAFFPVPEYREAPDRGRTKRFLVTAELVPVKQGERLLGAADTSGAWQKSAAVDMGAVRITAKTPRSITEVLLRVFREIA
jgi:hypothetical protein